ncbi:MAG TPA: L,D-transpeptidase family protein, partial [Chthonomonadaceae bacterium]|nr:L,D-transpeptidase family protein [Chthonomonadaceae bacterium]
MRTKQGLQFVVSGASMCGLAVSVTPLHAAKPAATVSPVIGLYRIVRVERADSLHKIARRYGVNIRVLEALNQIKKGGLKPGDQLTLPLLHIPPMVPPDGIVLNIAERQVYVMRDSACVATFPVAVGNPQWPTATGAYTVANRVVNPQWKPTKDMVERMMIRDQPVQPGPDNPVGDRWIGWSLKGYGFHSTTAPNSIGSAASHGCVRLYPEAAHAIFEMVKKG